MEILTGTPIRSIFDIAGRNENALTKSFGVILRRDQTLLSHFLSNVFRRSFRLHKEEFNRLSFRFEKSHEEGRVDIEIYLEGKFDVFIESKSGRALVGRRQAERYARALEKSACKRKYFVFLTEIGHLEISKKLRSKYPSIKFRSMGWQETLELLSRRRVVNVNLVDEYRSYLLEARKMRIHDIDIWAVVVRGKQVKNFDRHQFYIHGQRHSPIFIGKREWDKKLGQVVVRVLRPVLAVLDKDSPQGRKNGGVYVYKLGKPLTLTQPLVNRFSQTSAISIPFEKLAMLSH